ncbi:MAG: hypothetical protein FD189_1064 [Elusimicrobia bacterium]|nr:MAG: hypothetical protein FD189_1064 [Elusimicrobiota bacterium]
MLDLQKMEAAIEAAPVGQKALAALRAMIPEDVVRLGCEECALSVERCSWAQEREENGELCDSLYPGPQCPAAQP